MKLATQIIKQAKPASQTHSYYIDELKHEVKQAYFKHAENVLVAEAKNLALEIYHLSYGHREVSSMKLAESGVFFSETVKFSIDLGGELKEVRFDLPYPMPFLITHEPVKIELFVELWTHYDHLEDRMKESRNPKHVNSLLTIIDELADSLSITEFTYSIRTKAGHIASALSNIAKKTNAAKINESK